MYTLAQMQRLTQIYLQDIPDSKLLQKHFSDLLMVEKMINRSTKVPPSMTHKKIHHIAKIRELLRLHLAEEYSEAAVRHSKQSYDVAYAITLSLTEYHPYNQEDPIDLEAIDPSTGLCLSTGHVMRAENIKQWIETNPTNPFTQLPLLQRDLMRINRQIGIMAFKQTHKGKLDGGNHGDTIDPLIENLLINDTSAVLQLVENGADVNLTTLGNVTPVAIAALFENTYLTKYLKNKGALERHGAVVWQTLAEAAAKNKLYNQFILTLLGVHGSELDLVPIFINALRARDLDLVEQIMIFPSFRSTLMAENFSLKHGSDESIPLVALVAAHGTSELMEQLHEWGMPLDSRFDGQSALFISVSAQNGSAVNYLLEHSDLSVSERLESGATTLYQAIVNGQTELLRQLLTSSTADINELAVKEVPLICAAVLHNQPECLEVLLSHSQEPDMEATYQKHFNALHLTAKTGNIACLKMLMQHQGDFVEHHKTMALKIAKHYNHHEMVALLTKFELQPQAPSSRASLP
jgi:ankyrin repeat protein